MSGKIQGYIKEDGDWLLQRFVDDVNNRDFGFGITLHVNGFLVSGNLISVDKYFSSVGQMYASELEEEDKETAEKIRAFFVQFAEVGKDAPEDEKSDPVYFHLENVRFLSADGNLIVPQKATVWRGRINEVSGFMFGYLGEFYK